MVKPRQKATLVVAFVFTAIFAGSALAQSADDLKNDEKTPGDVLVYGMGYAGQRYSPLTKITKKNVGKMVPIWGYSMTDNRGAEAFPVVKDGVIYTTAHNATVAVDALTGKQIWRVAHEYPPETLRVVCCGIVNRGAAIYEGKLIRALLDNQIIALDAKTGKEVWKTKSPEPVSIETGYAMTGAPLIANGVVVVGVAGAEYSHRGFLEGYDPATGKHLWRLYTIPNKGEPGSDTWEGDSNLTGGGSSWVTGSYDPELDLVYWGIGNPSPWNPRARKGDNLFTEAIFAVRPKTGVRVWYYQTTPGDPFDYDAVQTPVIATIPVNGNPRKVVMQANRNGFLYVLDAKDGKLLAANTFGKVNWADGVDLKTGRPRFTDVYKGALEGKNVTVWPSVTGVTNWQHMSFSPKTGMLYINTAHVGMTYEAGEPPKLVPGKPSGPGTVKRTTVLDNPNIRGYLKAVDPMTGKSKWEMPYKSPNFSSTLVTASNLVFTGVMTGEFQALDADTGKVLWSFQTPSGIIGQPITWERNGKQYVTVMSGIGGVYALRAGDPNLANVPAGASMWTFGLFEK
ncbi:MAG: PQQ-dependent dehydrogenase, methanol/ethanol family [Pseudolabrys sp.]|nr:PQQ-dependent dehydrogenase, methanol/ethanol family [Pseudolabrys sp.]